MLNLIIVVVLQKWTLHLQLVQFDKQPENLCSYFIDFKELLHSSNSSVSWTCESLYAGKNIAIHVDLPKIYGRQMHTESSTGPGPQSTITKKLKTRSHDGFQMTLNSVPPSLVPRPHPRMRIWKVHTRRSRHETD